MTQPPNYDTHGNGFGHYMWSYMKYIPAKFAFVIFIMKQSCQCRLNMCKNAPETLLFWKKWAKFETRAQKYLKKTILAALFGILLLPVLLLIAHWFELYCLISFIQASIVNSHEYKSWREEGVAFELRSDSTYEVSNRSLASGLIIKKVTRRYKL